MKVAGMSALFAVWFGLSNFGGRPLRPAHWGGRNIEVIVRSMSTDIELSCAHGMITQQFSIDRHGHFDLPGTYASGPLVLPPPFHPAHYVGAVDGKMMRLTIILDESGETVGPFQLTRGVIPVIVKCL